MSSLVVAMSTPVILMLLEVMLMTEEPKILGLAMMPGHHIVRIWLDDTTVMNSNTCDVDSDQ